MRSKTRPTLPASKTARVGHLRQDGGIVKVGLVVVEVLAPVDGAELDAEAGGAGGGARGPAPVYPVARLAGVRGYDDVAGASGRKAEGRCSGDIIMVYVRVCVGEQVRVSTKRVR